MAITPTVSGATIAYHLRQHKAIERTLFINLLKHLNKASGINLKDYRYVGFGAAFLEDFKYLHAEFQMANMDCVEGDKFVFTRQQFNKPYEFIKLFREFSTEYINGADFKRDLNQIIWWDFARPRDIPEQLKDAELTAEKLTEFDILKFTFNAEINSFPPIKKTRKSFTLPNFKEALLFLQNQEPYKIYLPETITAHTLQTDFSAVLRAMALRAIRRGLVKTNPDLKFYHLASFDYKDGQKMTTVTGIVCKEENVGRILAESRLSSWEFYKPDPENEVIPAIDIAVPVMTIGERNAIDKLLHSDVSDIAAAVDFVYGESEEEHKYLMEGYRKFYRYLPYFSRVTY